MEPQDEAVPAPQLAASTVGLRLAFAAYCQATKGQGQQLPFQTAGQPVHSVLVCSGRPSNAGNHMSRASTPVASSGASGLSLGSWMRLCQDLGIPVSHGGPLSGAVIHRIFADHRARNSNTLHYMSFVCACAALSRQLACDLTGAVGLHGAHLQGQMRAEERSCGGQCLPSGSQGPPQSPETYDKAEVPLDLNPHEAAQEAAILLELQESLARRQDGAQPASAAAGTWAPREPLPSPHAGTSTCCSPEPDPLTAEASSCSRGTGRAWRLRTAGPPTGLRAGGSQSSVADLHAEVSWASSLGFRVKASWSNTNCTTGLCAEGSRASVTAGLRAEASSRCGAGPLGPEASRSSVGGRVPWRQRLGAWIGAGGDLPFNPYLQELPRGSPFLPKLRPLQDAPPGRLPDLLPYNYRCDSGADEAGSPLSGGPVPGDARKSHADCRPPQSAPGGAALQLPLLAGTRASSSWGGSAPSPCVHRGGGGGYSEGGMDQGHASPLSAAQPVQPPGHGRQQMRTGCGLPIVKGGAVHLERSQAPAGQAAEASAAPRQHGVAADHCGRSGSGGGAAPMFRLDGVEGGVTAPWLMRLERLERAAALQESRLEAMKRQVWALAVAEAPYPVAAAAAAKATAATAGEAVVQTLHEVPTAEAVKALAREYKIRTAALEKQMQLQQKQLESALEYASRARQEAASAATNAAAAVAAAAARNAPASADKAAARPQRPKQVAVMAWADGCVGCNEDSTSLLQWPAQGDSADTKGACNSVCAEVGLHDGAAAIKLGESEEQCACGGQVAAAQWVCEATARWEQALAAQRQEFEQQLAVLAAEARAHTAAAVEEALAKAVSPAQQLLEAKATGVAVAEPIAAQAGAGEATAAGPAETAGHGSPTADEALQGSGAGLAVQAVAAAATASLQQQMSGEPGSGGAPAPGRRDAAVVAGASAATEPVPASDTEPTTGSVAVPGTPADGDATDALLHRLEAVEAVLAGSTRGLADIAHATDYTTESVGLLMQRVQAMEHRQRQLTLYPERQAAVSAASLSVAEDSPAQAEAGEASSPAAPSHGAGAATPAGDEASPAAQALEPPHSSTVQQQQELRQMLLELRQKIDALTVATQEQEHGLDVLAGMAEAAAHSSRSAAARLDAVEAALAAAAAAAVAQGGDAGSGGSGGSIGGNVGGGTGAGLAAAALAALRGCGGSSSCAPSPRVSVNADAALPSPQRQTSGAGSGSTGGCRETPLPPPAAGLGADAAPPAGPCSSGSIAAPGRDGDSGGATAARDADLQCGDELRELRGRVADMERSEAARAKVVATLARRLDQTVRRVEALDAQLTGAMLGAAAVEPCAAGPGRSGSTGPMRALGEAIGSVIAMKGEETRDAKGASGAVSVGNGGGN